MNGQTRERGLWRWVATRSMHSGLPSAISYQWLTSLYLYDNGMEVEMTIRDRA
jgi:hypothetical protein